eukprot:6444697-Pyramimonas_sp.AAC.1
MSSFANVIAFDTVSTLQTSVANAANGLSRRSNAGQRGGRLKPRTARRGPGRWRAHASCRRPTRQLSPGATCGWSRWALREYLRTLRSVRPT